MSNIAEFFREYARLDLRRLNRGLSVEEHDRWSKLKLKLDGEFPKAEPSSSRRSAKRVQTQLNCSFSTQSDTCDAIISNLSTGGVYIRTEWPLPVDSLLRLQLRLEDSGKNIIVSGIVVSNHVQVEEGRRTPGMGVRFVQPDPSVVEEISSLYSQECTRESKESIRI